MLNQDDLKIFQHFFSPFFLDLTQELVLRKRSLHKISRKIDYLARYSCVYKLRIPSTNLKTSRNDILIQIFAKKFTVTIDFACRKLSHFHEGKMWNSLRPFPRIYTKNLPQIKLKKDSVGCLILKNTLEVFERSWSTIKTKLFFNSSPNEVPCVSSRTFLRRCGWTPRQRSQV